MRTDAELLDHVLSHIDNGTTDTCDEEWLEPVENYRSQARFDAEQRLMRRLPIAYCPAAVVAESGSYFARSCAGIPIVVVRDEGGELRAFRNACRHRGVQLTEGQGCAKIFRCTYHGWAYRLDGRLQHVPHEDGFPSLKKEENGLVPVYDVQICGGMVFVTVEEPIGPGALAALPELLTDDQEVFEATEEVEHTNWKLNAEGMLEGYHIKYTHTASFFPYGYDNLNVVETQGPNVRVCFPFQRIEKLRDAPRDDINLDRMVTLVNRIFPFASVTRLAQHYNVSLVEPLTPSSTRYYRFNMTMPGDASEEALTRAKKDVQFLAETGNLEDIKVLGGIQAAVHSEANEHYRFGKFESAIIHLHKSLHEHLALLDAESATADS
ncbi:MAG: aromatic ring-hydroxylating dioxygenase subunit alpha [Pseudomonadota bacterium]